MRKKGKCTTFFFFFVILRTGKFFFFSDTGHRTVRNRANISREKLVTKLSKMPKRTSCAADPS
jgi:hypothetical protein